MFKRIFIGYLFVLFASFAVLTMAFSLTVRYYLINDTIENLNRVAETLSSTATRQGMPGSGHMRGAYFGLANRIAYADYLVIQPDGMIIDSSDRDLYPPGKFIENDSFLKFAFSTEPENSLVDNDIVAVTYPVNIGEQSSAASLILYSKLDILSQLNRALLGLLGLSLLAGITVSLITGALATRVVVEPLQQLKKRAIALSRRQFEGTLSISTNDELEELAEAFNLMSRRLAEYDLSQKDFFQKASHELKTPLMSIQGYAEAIKDRIISPHETDQVLNIIIKESSRMKNLVEQFIMLSRLESMPDHRNFKPVCLDDAAREAIDSIQSLAFEKNIVTKTESSGEKELCIWADPEKIHRLFLNILGNALRYAHETITININGPELIITDDGPGFSPTDLPQIFKPFFRGPDGGSGLGLAISRAIIEQQGGSIDVTNAPRGGAMIKILFSTAKNEGISR